MEDSGYIETFSTARIWALIVALGVGPGFYIPVQLAVLQWLPTQDETLLFLAAVIITVALAVAAGFATRLAGDWILARTSTEAPPWLWSIPILLSGLSLVLASNVG